jgi:hypothetical protein
VKLALNVRQLPARRQDAGNDRGLEAHKIIALTSAWGIADRPKPAHMSQLRCDKDCCTLQITFRSGVNRTRPRCWGNMAMILKFVTNNGTKVCGPPRPVCGPALPRFRRASQTECDIQSVEFMEVTVSPNRRTRTAMPGLFEIIAVLLFSFHKWLRYHIRNSTQGALSVHELSIERCAGSLTPQRR